MNNILFPICTIEELYEEMPIIHKAIADKTSDPHTPILAERDLEIELTCLQHEHYMENDNLDDFPGLTQEIANIVIVKSIQDYNRIADIDGKGYLK